MMGRSDVGPFVMLLAALWLGAGSAAEAQTITWVPTPEPAAPDGRREAEAAPATDTAPATDATPATDAEPADAPDASSSAVADTETDAEAPEVAVDEGTLVIERAPDRAEGRALSTPRVDPTRAERALRNLAFAEQALAEERGAADITLAVAVNLYVGGALLSIVSASLLVGIVLESVCFNGVVDECLDGPSFLAGLIPSALGAVSLLVGARITEERATAHYRSLDARAESLETRRRAAPRAALAPHIDLSIGLGALGVVGRF